VQRRGAFDRGLPGIRAPPNIPGDARTKHPILSALRGLELHFGNSNEFFAALQGPTAARAEDHSSCSRRKTELLKPNINGLSRRR
jgi:hypothetical protein